MDLQRVADTFPAVPPGAHSGLEPPDFVLVSDVLHHIEPSARVAFLTEIRELIGGRPAKLVIKEVEASHFLARSTTSPMSASAGTERSALWARAR